MPNAREIALTVDRINPCPWCGAEPRQPCRANRGKGAELTLSVHPIRRKPTDAGRVRAAS